MASLSTYKNKSGELLRVIQFTERDGTRPKIGLGVCTRAHAEKIKGWVEKLIVANRGNVSIDAETAGWLAGTDDVLHKRLADLGLTSPRQSVEAPLAPKQVKLAEFIDGYIKGRAKIKPGTLLNLNRCRTVLVEYFGAERELASITPGDCDDFREKLRGMLGENTVARMRGRAKQYFRAAVRKKLIAESPFADMKGTGVQANRSRDYFVTRAEADAVIEACPNNDWKLIFALSRYGGLRCPSEHLELKWGDINWEAGKIVVRSPKTAHHAGHEMRIMPLWPELEPFLVKAREELLEDFDPKSERLSEQWVVRRYRGAHANMRTGLGRIITSAGIKPWPKLLTNCRATRATELADEYPGHVVSAWLGHSEKIADAHYRQVTDQHFARAVQNRVQQTAEVGGASGNEVKPVSEKPLDVREPLVLKGEPEIIVGLAPSRQYCQALSLSSTAVSQFEVHNYVRQVPQRILGFYEPYVPL